VCDRTAKLSLIDKHLCELAALVIEPPDDRAEFYCQKQETPFSITSIDTLIHQIDSLLNG
jgi:hypothetical protein